MVALEDVGFQYREGGFSLRVPSLRIAGGERIAIVGPSGSGKTTLLHLVAGVIPPGRGRIWVGDAEVSAMSDAERRAFRIRTIGMVFQEFELLDYLSVLDNILLPCRITGALPLTDAVRRRAAALADRVGLGGKLRRNVTRLSYGERQRVGVCRALLTKPPLLLADEPTGNLDPANKVRVIEILLEFAAETGATLVTVTHDAALLPRFGRVVDMAEWSASPASEEALRT